MKHLISKLLASLLLQYARLLVWTADRGNPIALFLALPLLVGVCLSGNKPKTE